MSAVQIRPAASAFEFSRYQLAIWQMAGLASSAFACMLECNRMQALCNQPIAFCSQATERFQNCKQEVARKALVLLRHALRPLLCGLRMSLFRARLAESLITSSSMPTSITTRTDARPFLAAYFRAARCESCPGIGEPETLCHPHLKLQGCRWTVFVLQQKQRYTPRPPTL